MTHTYATHQMADSVAAAEHPNLNVTNEMLLNFVKDKLKFPLGCDTGFSREALWRIVHGLVHVSRKKKGNAEALAAVRQLFSIDSAAFNDEALRCLIAKAADCVSADGKLVRHRDQHHHSRLHSHMFHYTSLMMITR